MIYAVFDTSCTTIWTHPCTTVIGNQQMANRVYTANSEYNHSYTNSNRQSPQTSCEPSFGCLPISCVRVIYISCVQIHLSFHWVSSRSPSSSSFNIFSLCSTRVKTPDFVCVLLILDHRAVSVRHAFIAFRDLARAVRRRRRCGVVCSAWSIRGVEGRARRCCWSFGAL
jgi:hypothetical protein